MACVLRLLLLLVLFLCGVCSGGWKDEHPQQRYRYLALRLPCYSCMSPYLEDHYPYIQHLYRKPISFDQHCDLNYLDKSYLYTRNCSDMCITLKINDIVGGRRRHGFVRGCLSDLISYNHSLVRALGDAPASCIETTARDLFVPTASRGELEPSRIALCACHGNLCNATPLQAPPLLLMLLLLLIAAIRL